MQNEIILTNLIWILGIPFLFISSLVSIEIILDKNPRLFKWLNNSIFGLGDVD